MISLDEISFSYDNREQIINDLSFNIPQGSLYGFLGANGSGKTTTIRLILGLCKPSKGVVLINGEQITRNSLSLYSKIGSLIEAPSLYSHLSGEDNLKVFCKYYGLNPKRINDVLDMVGLKYASQKRAGFYSLGMKQRLGLALSVLHNPSILILDEPLNGLDPKGIAEMRELLLHLNKNEGMTIMISSHILSEIASTCDNICIIDKGKKVFSGEINKLLNSDLLDTYYSVRTDKTEESLKIISDFIPDARLEKECILFPLNDEMIIPSLVDKLVHSGIGVYEVAKKENTLEQLYLKLTN